MKRQELIKKLHESNQEVMKLKAELFTKEIIDNSLIGYKNKTTQKNLDTILPYLSQSLKSKLIINELNGLVEVYITKQTL